jgi:hypothetical protein
MSSFIIRKTVLWIFFFLTAYYLVMELYYLNFVSTHYDRFRFELDLNLQKYVEAKILFALVLALSVFVSKTSEFMFSVLVFFIVLFLVPNLITYSLADQIPGPLYATVALLFALGAVSAFRIRIPRIKSETFSYGTDLFLILLAIVPIIFAFGIYFNPMNVVLADIQDTRAYFDENSTSLVNYLYNWLIKALVPVLMIYFLIRKQYKYGLVALVVLLYLYLISGNKLVYLTLFVMIFFFYYGKDFFGKTKALLIALLIGLLLIPLIDRFVLGSHALKGIFVMRTFFLPSQLNYFYFDFFDGKPLFFAESNLMKLFFTYPFDKPVGFVISETYFNATDMNSNNGIISDGFMNLGYWGIGLNIALVSGIFIFFNSLNLDSRYLGIFFVMVFLFLSAPMLSMFVTSGLWILFILALTVMREPKANEAPAR